MSLAFSRTFCAFGASRRKVMRRSGSTSGETTAGADAPRPCPAAGAAGAGAGAAAGGFCCAARDVAVNNAANVARLTMPSERYRVMGWLLAGWYQVDPATQD